mgnify:FL=1
MILTSVSCCLPLTGLAPRGHQEGAGDEPGCETNNLFFSVNIDGDSEEDETFRQDAKHPQAPTGTITFIETKGGVPKKTLKNLDKCHKPYNLPF